MGLKIIISFVVSFCCFYTSLFAEETVAPQEKSPFIRGSQTLDSNSNAWEESILNLRNSAEILIQNHDKLAAESEALKKELFDLTDSIKGVKEKKEHLVLEPERLNKQVQESEAKYKLLQSQIKALEKELADLEKGNISLQKELTRLETRLDPRSQEIDRLRQKKVDLEFELELLVKAADTPQIQEFKQEVESVKEALSSKQKKEQEFQKTLEEEEQKYTALLADIQSLKKENQQLSGDLAQAQRAVKTFSDGMAHLRSEE